MIVTAMGTIEVSVNGCNINYDYKELPNTDGKTFIVDKRYKVVVKTCDNTDGYNFVECTLNAIDDFTSCQESGQNLELISFFRNNLKLCIGVESHVPDVPMDRYAYLHNGLRVMLPDPMNEVIFGIAWLEMKDKDSEYNFPFFAADPTWKDFRSI